MVSEYQRIFTVLPIAQLQWPLHAGVYENGASWDGTTCLSWTFKATTSQDNVGKMRFKSSLKSRHYMYTIQHS